MEISKEQFFDLYGSMLNGAMANPTNGHSMWDSYDRQQLMQGLLADLELALAAGGHKVVESDLEIKFVTDPLPNSFPDHEE